MRRVIVPLGTLLMVCGLVGCGTDPREQKINDALNNFTQDASQMKTVTDKLTEALNKAKAENKPLTDQTFKTVVETAHTLKKPDEPLLKIRGEIEVLQENTTADQKERLKKQYEGQLNNLVKGLIEEQKKLDTELARAETIAEKRPTQEERTSSRAAVEKLRAELHKSLENFVALSRPR